MTSANEPVATSHCSILVQDGREKDFERAVRATPKDYPKRYQYADFTPGETMNVGEQVYRKLYWKVRLIAFETSWALQSSESGLAQHLRRWNRAIKVVRPHRRDIYFKLTLMALSSMQMPLVYRGGALGPCEEGEEGGGALLCSTETDTPKRKRTACACCTKSRKINMHFLLARWFYVWRDDKRWIISLPPAMLESTVRYK